MSGRQPTRLRPSPASHNLLLFSSCTDILGSARATNGITDTGKTPRREFFGIGNGVSLDMFSSLSHHPTTDLHGSDFFFVFTTTSFHKTLLTI